ncbi:MAG: transcriptional repressor LexA [Bdellovibrionaceae bacterium]|nr:transcriptional repressor LexA [Pseudobdellovibrionaceae bacterium]
MSLTPKQKQVLDFIVSFSKKKGVPPTHQNMMDHFGWTSPGTVQDFLKILQKRGYLTKDWKTASSIRVLDPEQHIPLMGKVAAGRPLEHNTHDEFIEIPEKMRKAGGDFVLQVQGDSMIDEGILDGDYVVIKKSEDATSGDIVVAVIDSGATIKTFFKKKDYIELHSANPKYKPIVIKEGHDFRIAGIYCGLIRY